MSDFGLGIVDTVGIEASVIQTWAKADSTTGRWRFLLWHSVETSVVASVLWDEVLAPATRSVIAAALGLPVDVARRWSLFLAGLRDLGKASPPLQGLGGEPDTASGANPIITSSPRA